MIVWGTRLYGWVDGIEGQGMVATRFFHLMFVPLDAAPIVAELVASARAVRPSVRVNGHSPHQVPEAALRVGLGTLLDNALEASTGQVEVDVTPLGAMLRIEVRDHGPGIAPDLAPRLFTPGASTRGRNRGEGLAVARDVAHAAGGDLRCEALHPTVFTLELPSS